MEWHGINRNVLSARIQYCTLVGTCVACSERGRLKMMDDGMRWMMQFEEVDSFS